VAQALAEVEERDAAAAADMADAEPGGADGGSDGNDEREE
jgi:hypothetical protein